MAGLVISLIVSLISGYLIIPLLLRRKIQEIHQKQDAPKLAELSKDKKYTPTMGGIIIILAIVVALAIVGNFETSYTAAALVLTLGLGGVGMIDDFSKLTGKGKIGISGKFKMALLAIPCIVSTIIVYQEITPDSGNISINIPLADYSIWLPVTACFMFSIFVLLGSTNAVNLTDGLDGLASGTMIFAASGFAIVAIIAAGDYMLLAVSGISRIQAGEVFVISMIVIGALMGFLWYNSHPAQIFMGDTGSLALGGLLGLMAIMIRQELLLVIIGGLFVIEAMSVILQVVSFKLTHKRIFACSPIHHHFQFKGWPETRIVGRFWIVGAVLAIAGVVMFLMEKDDGPDLLAFLR
ncbi:MAG: phospho-N-acetylmuramoyl-pentapeptide-transferase [Planctomycetes bacterium]|nr:phospho-N-acetylmuramoyl-pentapeptide-transferase [Planctomycetota bacterium]